jgi:hypothetical protein
MTLPNGTYVRMVPEFGSPKITGTVQTEINYLGKPQMLFIVDPRLNWKPDRFFVYEGSIEPCDPPSDAEIEHRNKLLEAFNSE